MAYTRIPTTSNNVLTFDSVGRTVIPGPIKALGLASAGFVKTDAQGNFYIDVTGGSGGSGGHIILNSAGTALPQQPNLKFSRLTVTNDGTNSLTLVSRPADSTVGTTPPSSPVVGDVWTSSETWKTYKYYDGYWVEYGTGTVTTGGGGSGTVTSVSGTGTVSGLTLTGTVTTSGSLTLGGTLSVIPSNFASQTANTVLAAPSGTTGVPTFRTLVAADIPALSYQSVLNGTGYVKMSGTTVSYLASIPNSDLTNSSITVQGTAVSLGGSVNVINGTGFVKAAGTTISYDNSTYLTTSAASSTYLPLSGGTLTGNLASSAASVSFQRFSILPSGYIELNPINFRFDQDCLRHINRWGTATITAPDFTSNELDSLFSQYASNINLQAKTPPVSIEVTGFNIGSSANNRFYPYVFLHSANQLGSIKMEVLKAGAPTTWETAYDGAIPSTGFVIAEYASGTGNLIGVRWTFYNYTANPHYIRYIGCISRNGPGYAWSVLKGGDTMYGDLNFTSPYTVRVAGNQVLHTGNFTTSVVSANGFAGTVANATTTPAISLSTTVTGILKGNGTSVSAAVAGTDYLLPNSLYTDYDVTVVGLRNSVNKVFTTSFSFVSGSTKVYVNGIRYTPGASYDYQETGANQITFTNAPDSGDLLIIEYIKI
jgi:hypothetical protein